MNINKKSVGNNLAAVSGKDVKIDPESHYDNWARKYEYELLNEYGYCAHIIAAEALLKYELRKDCEIIDIGCGTGLVAEELISMGFSNITGLDISSKMIAIAKGKGLYKKLYKKRVEDVDNSIFEKFDVLTCVGSFGLGHIGPKSLKTLMHLVKKGSIVIIFMNAEPFIFEDYKKYIENLVSYKAVEVITIEDHNYMSKIERPGKLMIFRRQ